MQSYDARTIEKLKIYGRKKWREKKKEKQWKTQKSTFTLAICEMRAKFSSHITTSAASRKNNHITSRASYRNWLRRFLLIRLSRRSESLML